MTLALRSPFQQVLLISMAVAVALFCLFSFVPRAQAAQLTEPQIQALEGLLAAFNVDEATIATVDAILRAPAGEVLGASTAAMPAAILNTNGFSGLPGAIEQNAGVTQTDVSQAKSNITTAVSTGAPTSASAVPSAVSKTLNLKASGKSVEGKGFSIVVNPFRLAATSNLDGISGSVSVESNNPSQFSEALISVFATSLDNCPKSSETFSSYDQIWKKYPKARDHVVSYILKLSGESSASMPVDFALPAAKSIAPCVLVLLDGGFPNTNGVLNMNSNMTLKYHGGDAPDSPVSIVETGDEVYFGASYGELSTPGVGPTVAFRTVVPITSQYQLLALVGDVSDGAFTGNPYPAAPSGAWSTDNSYYLYPACDLAKGSAGPGDYYNSIPPNAKKLFSVSMQGNGKKSLQQPVNKIFSDVTLNPGDCLVHLVRMEGGNANGTQGAIDAENQVRAVVQVVPPLSISIAPSTVVSGESATFTWSAKNVDSCQVLNGSGIVATGLKGKKSTGPLTAAATYKLVCTNSAPASASFIPPAIGDASIAAPANAVNAADTLTARATVSVSGLPDKTKPTITFTSPANSRKVSGSVYLSVDAADRQSSKGQTTSGLSSVSFAINGKVVSTDTDGPYAYVWHTESIATGTYSIVATARDNVGNEASTTHSVVVSHVAAANTPLVRLNRFYYSFEEIGDHMDLPLEQKPSYVDEPYKKEGSLGYISTVPGPGLTGLYECLNVYNEDYGIMETMTSVNKNCEGTKYLALLGYIWTNPGQSSDFAPLYRCLRSNTETYYGIINVTFVDHYSTRVPPTPASNDMFGSKGTCQGGGVYEGILGYVSTKSAVTPGLSLSASPVGVEVGKSAVLTWSATNASSCQVLQGNTPFAEGISGTKSTGNLTRDTIYRLTCSSTSGSRLATTTTVGVRAVGDALVSIQAVDPLAAESGGTGQYFIRRSGSLASSLIITFSVGGSATRNADYRLSAGGISGATGLTITIPVGAASTTVILTPLQDKLVEGTESAQLALVRGTGYALGAPNAASVSIADDETPIPATVELRSFSNTTYQDNTPFVEYAEGVAGSYPGWSDNGSLGFIATAPGTGRVELMTCSDTLGIAGFVTYTGVGSCQFGYTNVGTIGYGWSAAATGRQPLYSCSTATRTYLSTSQMCGGTPFASAAFYTQTEKVTSVPTTVGIAATVATASEGGASGAFALTRTGTDLSALAVTLGISGSAVRGSDYTLSGGGLTSTGYTVTIPAGSTQVVLTLTPINDTAVEGNETVLLSVLSSSKYKVGTSGATVTIADNDKAPVVAPTATLSASPASVGSGQSSTLTWNATNAASCVGTGFTASGIGGSATVKPAATTKYTVTCSATGTTTKATASATVSVTAAPPPSPKSCTFDGRSIPSASSTIAYKESSVPAGSSCHGERRTCTDGTLSGSYQYASCTVQKAATPTVTLTASPASISSGGSSVLTWKATNAISCAGTGFATGGATNGSVSVKPAVKTTYTITCSATGSTVKATASATVSVVAGHVSYAAADLLAAVVAAPFNLTVDSLTNIFVMMGIGQPQPAAVAAAAAFRSYPSVAQIQFPSATLENGINKTLLRFKISAGASGSIGIGQLYIFKSAQVGVFNVSPFKVYVYRDSSYSIPVDPYIAGFIGTVDGTNNHNKLALAQPLEIPAGQTYYFSVNADISGAQKGYSMTTILYGDTSSVQTDFAKLATFSAIAPGYAFVWSPNTRTTSIYTDPDWTSGYKIGIPENGLFQTLTAANVTASITVISPTKGTIFSTTTIPFSWSWKGISAASATPVMRLLDANGNEKYGMLGKEGGLSFTDAGGSGVLPPPANLIIPTGKAIYEVQICSAFNNGLCVVGAPFYIVKAPTVVPGITVIYPNGGEILDNSGAKGSGAAIATIQWSSSGLRSLPIEIDLINADTNALTSIVASTANTGSYRWNYDARIPDGHYKVLVSTHDKGPTAQDSSNNFFTLSGNSQKAAFSASPTSGQAPLAVSFSASGLNTTGTYRIDFGDSSTQALHPECQSGGGCSFPHTYAKAGTYQGALSYAPACTPGTICPAVLQLVGKVTITVSGGNTSNAPTLTLTASPSSIISGKSSTLAWSSKNATSCKSVGSEITSSINLSGTAVVSPLKGAVYTLTCTGPGGSVTQSVTITVTPQSTDATISGTVWNDANGNKTIDSGERGMAGQTVQLLDSTTGAVLKSATTNVSGAYSIQAAPGSYRLQIVMPSGYQRTTDNSFVANFLSGSNTRNFGIELTPGAVLPGVASVQGAALASAEGTGSIGQFLSDYSDAFNQNMAAVAMAPYELVTSTLTDVLVAMGAGQ